jgi:RNA polymerase sigma-70 factor (ECF subfamily)
MEQADPDTVRALLERAASGDTEGWRQVVACHHDRLHRMVALRLDPRLRGRLDPSDILQEAYLEAAAGLAEYLKAPELPPFLWLRRLAGSRLAKAHRAHLGTQKRDASREVSLDAPIPEASSVVLAACLLGTDRPSEAVAQDELRSLLQAALEQLDPLDREALVLRHFEQLNSAEVARELGISEAAAGKRYLRALQRLRTLLKEAPGGLDLWQP